MGNTTSAAAVVGEKEVKCHYRVLEVEQEASADELKRAYRQKALLLHPDKNPHRVAEATAEFAEVQRAYEVLSDPQERAWYDRHRESILRKSNSHAKDAPTVEDLMAYFSATVYEGYEDGPQGFFAVYRDLFEEIEEMECEAEFDAGGIQNQRTSFGSKNTPFEPSLAAFYDRWLHFTTSQTFEHLDRYSSEYGDNRRMRRAMEKENQRLREQIRREFSETVRSLAQFVRKRDPRYKAHLRMRADQRKEREEASRRTRKQNLCERDQAFVEPDWAKHELDELTKAASEFFNDPDEEGGSDDSEDVEKEFYCAVCRKLFRSQRQWKNHEQSRKHRDTLQRMGFDDVGDVENEEEEVVNETELDEAEAIIENEDVALSFDNLHISPVSDPIIMDENVSNIPTKKKPSRRRAASSSSNTTDEHSCTVCGETFESRNKLFEHIRLLDHAHAPPPAAKTTARKTKRK